MEKGCRWLVCCLFSALFMFGANAQTETTASAEAATEAATEAAAKETLVQHKAEVCAACHGPTGVSPNPIWPSLAGQSIEYLTKELKNFRDGKRTDPLMTPQAASLTDGDIEDLANFYASQPLPQGKVKADLLALGEKLYRGGDVKRGLPACMGCHSPNGQGNTLAVFPSLSGQHPEYIADQLKKFRAGQRTDDPNSIMEDIAKLMSDEEILAVSSYVSGLH